MECHFGVKEAIFQAYTIFDYICFSIQFISNTYFCNVILKAIVTMKLLLAILESGNLKTYNIKLDF